jgi:hypothetical protein
MVLLSGLISHSTRFDEIERSLDALPDYRLFEDNAEGRVSARLNLREASRTKDAGRQAMGAMGGHNAGTDATFSIFHVPPLATRIPPSTPTIRQLNSPRRL